jgi:hypothetical protein
MIAYQEYNTKSPLNGLAAKWAAQHMELLPVDSRNIAPPVTSLTTASNVNCGMGLEPENSNNPTVSSRDPWSQKISIE